jgi:hypothetical protein
VDGFSPNLVGIYKYYESLQVALHLQVHVCACVIVRQVLKFGGNNLLVTIMYVVYLYLIVMYMHRVYVCVSVQHVCICICGTACVY